MELTSGQSRSAITLPWLPAIPDHLSGIDSVEARALVAGTPHAVSTAEGLVWYQAFWDQAVWAEILAAIGGPERIDILLSLASFDLLLVNNKIKILLDKNKRDVKL